MTRGDVSRLHLEEHGWVLFRLAGWALLVLAQALLILRLVSPRFLVDDDVAWLLPLIGIAGSLVVAYGFARFVRTSHLRSGLPEPPRRE